MSPTARTLSLPWPPTVNTYWRHVMIGRAPRVLLSAKGREYRDEVVDSVDPAQPKMDGRLSVKIAAYPPDRRTRDLDNLLKPILDGLAHAGVYADDGQIDSLTIQREAVEAPDGMVLVYIEKMEAA